MITETRSLQPGRVLPVAGLAAAMLLVACEKPVEHVAPVRPVKMLEIAQPGEFSRREYPGTIEAIQHIDMAFEVSGRITDFPVEEGQRVEEGDVLARLDPRDYEAKLESAQANVRKAEADLNRTERLYKQDPGAIAMTQLDADRRALEVTQAMLKEAEKAFEDTTLTAPFSGYMARKLVRDFANVQAKEPVLILQDVSTLKLVVSVPERDFAGGTQGTKEEITARTDPRVVVSAIPDRSFPARLKELARTADPVTRTFAATVEFDVPKGTLVLPGMTAKLLVRSRGSGERISIPAQAASADAQGNAFVWVVDSQTLTVRRQPVGLGEFSGSDVEVLQGLAPGDVIAVSGIQQLREGMQVRRFEEKGAGRRG